MHQALDSFEAGFNRATLMLAALVAISIGLTAFLIPLNLLLIKVRWGSIWWLHEAVEYALYFGVFVGAPWVLHQGAHVKVDVITSALSPQAAARVEKFMDLVGALICTVLFVYGVRITICEFEDGTMPDKGLRIATWTMMAVFALSFLLLTIEFLLRFRRSHLSAAEAEPDTSKAGF